MKKKPAKPAMPPLADTLETAIRETIRRHPGVAELSEADYCLVVDEALSVILEGVRMRAEEIET